MTRRVLLVAAACCAAAVAVGASAAPERPPGTLLGVLGGAERFDDLTGQRTKVGHVIMAWGQGGSQGWFTSLFSTMSEMPMLGIATGGAIKPLEIAQGRGDSMLVELNAAVGEFGKPIYIRPFGEMNGHWNDYCAGSPDIPGNSAQAYYPGDAYVDVVDDDLYFIRGKAEWEAAEKLYAAHPGKPFSFPEWGLWGLDDPSFVAKMADWVRTHRRTEMIAYFNGRPGSIFDIGSKPASRAAYRKLIAPRSFFDAFPDINHSTGGLDVDGDTVSTDVRVTGTHTEPMVTPQGTIPATGKRIEIAARNVMEVESDSIAKLRISFDPGDFMRQLGMG